MFAQGFWWFFAATVLNGFMMVETISWNCLLVEDAEPSRLVDMYTWITVAGLLAVFFAPAAGWMVRRMTLVPAIRYVYGFAFVMMTAKTVILFFTSRETGQGKTRMKETRGVPYVRLLAQYSGVLGRILRSPATLQVLAIIVLLNITNMVSNTYFALYATRNAGVPEWVISYFPIARSLIMLVFTFRHPASAVALSNPQTDDRGLASTSCGSDCCCCRLSSDLLRWPVTCSGRVRVRVGLAAAQFADRALCRPRRAARITGCCTC
jgi:Na+/melibiose symporter-like transporter